MNAEPQRPTCIWGNSDNGQSQIQTFDAYTGEACGEGVIRVLGSQFVVPAPQCTPASYVSVQVLQPARATYTSGSVGFDDNDGNPIAGLPERTLDETGTVSLAGLSLNTPTGLPQAKDRSNPYWPYALGTSDYSTLSEWPGGGVVGIHGPFGEPQAIPGDPSHGCVRMRDGDIAWLGARVTLGTPVEIVRG